MEEIKISSFFTKTFKWKKARDGILGKIWLSIRWLHPGPQKLLIEDSYFLKSRPIILLVSSASILNYPKILT